MTTTSTARTTERPAMTRGRVLIVDEDVQYAKVLSRALYNEGFDPSHVDSLSDLGGYHRLQEFDIAIVDFFQGASSDTDIDEYMGCFARYGVDVLMTSSLDIKEIRDRCEGRSWPAHVHRFLCKSYGIEYTLDTLLDLTRTRKALATAARH